MQVLHLGSRESKIGDHRNELKSMDKPGRWSGDEVSSPRSCWSSFVERVPNASNPMCAVGQGGVRIDPQRRHYDTRVCLISILWYGSITSTTKQRNSFFPMKVDNTVLLRIILACYKLLKLTDTEKRNDNCTRFVHIQRQNRSTRRQIPTV